MTLAEDLELLHALQIAPRASWRSLGAAIHRSPAALANRWQELTDAGLAWCTAVPFGDGSPGVTAFIALLGEPGQQQTLIDQAVLIPEVISIEVPARRWDLILTVLVPNMDVFLRSLQPRIASLEGLTRHETILCTRRHFGGHEWRLNVLDPAARAALQLQDRVSVEESKGIREEDRALIPLLFRNGRASVTDIAGELSTHSSTVSRRLNRFLADPAITLRCDVAPELVGQPISCQWFCRLPPNLHDSAAAVLRTLPDLRYCASTTGQTNFTFVLWVKSPEDIFEIEREVVERIEHLTISESSVTVRFIKRMGWRLDDRGRRTGDPVLPMFMS